MNESTGSRSKGRMFVLLGLHAVSAGILLWLLLRHIPQYESLCRDYGWKLPDSMTMVVHLSAWFGKFWYLVTPGLAGGDLAIMIFLHRSGRAGLMTAWGVLAWIAQMLLIVLIAWALIESLSDATFRLSGQRVSLGSHRGLREHGEENSGRLGIAAFK